MLLPSVIFNHIYADDVLSLHDLIGHERRLQALSVTTEVIFFSFFLTDKKLF